MKDSSQARYLPLKYMFTSFIWDVLYHTFEKNYRWFLIMYHGETRMNNSDIYN